MLLFEYAVILAVLIAFLFKASIANVVLMVVSWLPIAILKVSGWLRKAPRPIDPQQKLVFKFPTDQKLASIAGCLGFVLAAKGILEIGPSTQNTMAWWGMGFFGLGAVVSAGLLWKDMVSLTLSDKGLEYSRFKVGPIAWKDIQGISPTTLGRSTIINLHLVDEEAYFARGKPRKKFGESFAKRMGLSSFCFSTQLLGANSTEIVNRSVRIRAPSAESGAMSACFHSF